MFGYNSLHQAKNMLKDLKLGQYVHLAPRCVFAVQIFGTMLGCLVSYIMMEKITDEKRHILLSIQGTNIWSGQSLQSKNSAVSNTCYYEPWLIQNSLLVGAALQNTCTVPALAINGYHCLSSLGFSPHCHSGWSIN